MVREIDRVKSICCHFVRNYAFFLAGEDICQKKRGASQFWRLANGNFAEIATIEFCKLFGGRNEKHRWQNIIKDQATFIDSLKQATKVSPFEFEQYRKSIKGYRDQYLAHLDAVAEVPFPSLDLAMKAVSAYYDHILSIDGPGGFPTDLGLFFKKCHAEAIAHYPQST